MDQYGKVESLDFFGNGILHQEGKCCFIKNALPKEEIHYRLSEEKKRYAKGVSTEICLASPYRQKPFCACYGQCGGCDFQHVDYRLEVAAKENHVLRSLKQIGGMDDFEFLPLAEGEQIYGYRNHATFQMKEGRTCFYQAQSHRHVSVEQCGLLEPVLNEALFVINGLALKEADTVALRCDNTGHLVAVIYGNIKRDLADVLEKHEIFTGIVTVWEKGTRVYGDEYLYYDFDGRRLKVSFRSFFQVNTEAALSMLRYCRTLTESCTHRRILDLYCGVGSIGLYLASPEDRLYGIEIVKDAVILAGENAKNNGIKAKYLAGKTEQQLRSFLKQIPQADFVILDPPRQGLQKNTPEILLEYAAETILYISCDPASLSRDLKALSEKYKLISAKPFDLFPRTSHVETVVLLSQLKQKPDDYIDVTIELDDVDITSAETKATYDEIKKYVAEHNAGMKVSNLYISQVKRKCGIEVGKNYNLPKHEDSRQPQCPEDKESAIVEALKHFKMIQKN